MSGGTRTLENIRVLVVEDNAVNIRVIRAILDRTGCHYIIAEDGKIALEYCERDAFQVILMDCQMPHMDGFQATRHIREQEAKGLRARCPIIALTANAMIGDREKCLAAGMDDFLSKPFRNRELVEKILNWTSGGRKV